MYGGEGRGGQHGDGVGGEVESVIAVFLIQEGGAIGNVDQGSAEECAVNGQGESRGQRVVKGGCPGWG